MKTPRLLQRTQLFAIHKRRLADWLKAWELDHRLSTVHLEPEAAALITRHRSGEIASRIARFDDTLPKLGEIRLLSSLLVPECPRPLYVAVLAEQGLGQWLLCPYGRFSVPATPGELLTDREAAALRVLCVWNAQPVNAEILKRSWLVDQMSPRELEDSLRILQSNASEKGLPAALQRRVGPPLFRKDDPRFEYQAQEAAFLKALKTKARESGTRLGVAGRPGIRSAPSQIRGHRGFISANLIRLPGMLKRPEEEQFSLAAAGKKSAKKPTILRVLSPPVQIRFTLEGDGETVSVWVLDRKGEPSSMLNASKFVSKEGAELATILDAQCLLPGGQIRAGFQLATKEGKLVKFRKASRE